jgi:hypothetical protein
MVNDLELMNPSVAKKLAGTGPWLEYPWQAPSGSFPELGITDAQLELRWLA